MNYNLIKDTLDISNESGPVTEPVSLEEMKNYLRQEGFIDDDDSTAITDFEDDDTMIEELISGNRETLEELLNVSIVSHSWRAVGATNLAGNVQLKYAPVSYKNSGSITITSILDSEGEAYDESDADVVRLVGNFLKFPNDCDMTIEYDVVVIDVPKTIKTEIMRMVAYQYENRGDVDGLTGYKYSDGIYKYSRQQLFS